MKNLIKAVNKVMEACENVDKNLNVGAGAASYKGVADKDVKLMINRAMRANGLAMFPVKIEPKLNIERWEEATNYGVKRKVQAFTEVLVTYKLIHETGEEIEVQGYGHGVDSQDKSAGKATTYALKYALLYQFMVATGEIDDADKTHSNETENPKPKAKPKTAKKTPIEAARPTAQADKKGENGKKWITPEQLEKALDCGDTKKIEAVFEKMKLRPEQKEQLQEYYNDLKINQNQ